MRGESFGHIPTIFSFHLFTSNFHFLIIPLVVKNFSIPQLGAEHVIQQCLDITKHVISVMHWICPWHSSGGIRVADWMNVYDVDTCAAHGGSSVGIIKFDAGICQKSANIFMWIGKSFSVKGSWGLPDKSSFESVGSIAEVLVRLVFGVIYQAY